MRILFVMPNAHYLRNYESVIRSLCKRGHFLVVGLEGDSETIPPEIQRFAEKLVRGHREFLRIETLPERRSFWSGAADQIRALRDFCRYQLPAHQHAHRCAKRAASVLIWPFRFLTLVPGPLRVGAAKATLRLAAWAEQIIPASYGAREALRRYDPDIVLVTPLIDIGSDQIDYVKACRNARIPVAHCVASWDNLTNKGLIKALPDRIFVWNEAQQREAVELHGIPKERVVITGAQIFDHWFDYKPSRSREEFCRELDLDPKRPIVLYTASSIFICRNEIDFVVRWLTAVRATDNERLRDANVLIRPHPKATKSSEQWYDERLKALGPVVVFPRGGHTPISPRARDDYFDSLHHCAAVVGINTSAMLEAGIVGRRCFTVLLDEVREGQEGMVHFRHLTRDGFLGVTENLEDHTRELSDEVANGPTSSMDFVQAFLRPYGLDQPTTPIFIAHAEEMEGMPVEPPALSARLGWMARPLLLPVVLLNGVFGERTSRAMRDVSKRVYRDVQMGAHRAAKTRRKAARLVQRLLRKLLKLLGRVARFAWRVPRQGRAGLGNQLRRLGLLPARPTEPEPLPPNTTQVEALSAQAQATKERRERQVA